LITTLAVFFILAVFQPFQFNLNRPAQLKVLAGFAFIALSGSSCVYIIFPKLFTSFYNPDRWTLGRALLRDVMLLLLIGVMVVAYDFYLVETAIGGVYTLHIFLVDVFAVCCIGIVPIIITNVILQNLALKRNLNELQEMNQTLLGSIGSDTNADRLTPAGSTKEALTLMPDEVLFMEAAGNYVDVYYIKEGALTHKLLRSTIKQMDESLQDQPMLVRCHRAFIVNVHQITHISGNAQGYKLILRNTPQKVPVSRSYLKKLKESLRNR
jgi:DNA-binding LytR/AlgR family response regulator